MVKISIIGAGNAGFGLALHLSLKGHQVALYAHPNHPKSIEPVKREGKIYGSPEEEGIKAALSGTGEVVLATTDAAEAVAFANILIIVLPVYAQIPVFELLLPHLRDGQIIVNMPGNFAALEFSRIMRQKGMRQNITFIDTDSTVQTCRKLKQPDNGVFISGLKIGLKAGVLPVELTDKMITLLSGIIPSKLHQADNVIIPGFLNINLLDHPVPTILNLGWSEATGGNFKYYAMGCSPSICRVIDAVDKERQAIANVLGVKISDYATTFKLLYGDEGLSTTYDILHNSMVHRYYTAPCSLATRYITEDLCYNLMPIAVEGNKRGVPTPTIDALIHIASTFIGEPVVAKRNLGFMFDDEKGLKKRVS